MQTVTVLAMSVMILPVAEVVGSLLVKSLVEKDAGLRGLGKKIKKH
jgi:hypothetical protein